MERIVVVGAGRSASALVRRLARLGPVTVVDTSAAALSAMGVTGAAEPDAPEAGAATGTSTDASPGTPGVAAAHPVAHHVADATSRLVLEDLRGDVRDPVALVVATGNDRATIEVCRLAADLRYKPMLAVVNEPAAARPCEELGARAIVKALLVGQVVEQVIQSGGIGMGSDVGFGRGELLEVRVLPSSPVIGVRLSQLRADGWRVAAIYRGAELVLPTGRTTIAAEDRVLVIGDPKLLPHVGETLRVGLPTFPLLHGPNVVAYLPAGRDDGVEAEAEVVALRTRAAGLVRVYPGAQAARTAVVETLAPEVLLGAHGGRRDPGDPGSTSRKPVHDAPLEGRSLADHLASLRARRPGVVVARPPKRGLGDVLFGRGGAAAALCNDVGVPVLFPGTPPYGRVVFGVTDTSGDLPSADVALDLARMFEVPLTLLCVRLPGYLGAPDPGVAALVETVAHRAHLHDMKIDVQEPEGNPLREWARAARPSDLYVLGRRRTTRDSYTTPDVPLRFARARRCAVLVCTEEG